MGGIKCYDAQNEGLKIQPGEVDSLLGRSFGLKSEQ